MIVDNEFDFGEAVRTVRLSRKMTQMDVCHRMGFRSNRVSNWEMPSGSDMPTLKDFRRLCLVLNCPPGDLLGISPAPLSSDEYTLIKGFRDLDEAGKHTMMAVLESQLAVRSGSDG